MHLKWSSGKWRPFCLGLNVLSVEGTAISWGALPAPLVRITPGESDQIGNSGLSREWKKPILYSKIYIIFYLHLSITREIKPWFAF